ncbi:MAG: hypothetical protein Q8O82_04880 [Pseudorhodobacter sp.]|nr:hypothetical protein [Pseudorhodobacter sp.]
MTQPQADPNTNDHGGGVDAAALRNLAWADATRARLTTDASRLDAMMGLQLLRGTSLFRLHDTDDAAARQAALARHRIWGWISRYNSRWLRLGLPGAARDWVRPQAALQEVHA